jgi:hypothetical protein
MAENRYPAALVPVVSLPLPEGLSRGPAHCCLTERLPDTTTQAPHQFPKLLAATPGYSIGFGSVRTSGEVKENPRRYPVLTAARASALQTRMPLRLAPEYVGLSGNS